LHSSVEVFCSCLVLVVTKDSRRNSSYFVFCVTFSTGEDEKLLGLQLGRYWSNLAANLDPNVGMPLSGGVPPSTLWPAYTESTDEAMVLRTPVASAMLPESGLKASHCDFWDANPVPTEAVFGTL